MKFKRLGLFCIITALLLTSCGKLGFGLKKPEFPQTGAAQDVASAQVEWAVKNETIPQKMPVYRVKNQKADEEQTAKLLSLFGFSEPTITKDTDPAGRAQIVYQEGSKYLRVVNSTIFVYLAGQRATEEQLSLSDDEVKKQAKEFLQENDLLPEGFVMNERLGYTELTGDGIDTPIVSQKTVEFHRQIDGIKVYGVAKVAVSFTNNGISEVYCVYDEYELDRSYDCKSFAEAKAALFSSDARVSVESDYNVESVRITDCEMVYYANAAVGMDTIHPCIRFKGEVVDSKGETVTFSSMIPALTEESYR